ncbi:Hypothetical predicted protein, partial [Pelobates cultripes]
KSGAKKSGTPLDNLYNANSLLFLEGLFRLQSTGEEYLEQRLSIRRSPHHRQCHHTQIPYSPQPGETSTSYVRVHSYDLEVRDFATTGGYNDESPELCIPRTHNRISLLPSRGIG